MTRSNSDVEAVLRLHALGRGASEIARDTSIPRSTVRGWITSEPAALVRSRATHEPDECDARVGLGADYAFVLGLYLGDGCLSQQTNGVWKLRLVCDSRYPDLIDEWALAVASVLRNVVGRVQRTGCIELTSHSKHWFCLLPQHGPGTKHNRLIQLESWQVDIVERHPAPFVRGLIFSDGCRVINRVGQNEYGRYFFTNTSQDILEIAREAIARLGVEARQSNPKNLSVARRSQVAVLDEFIGFKH